MSRFVRFGDTIINYNELVWVGIIQNISQSEITTVAFQFTNMANNFTLSFPDKKSAVEAVNSFGNLLHSAVISAAFPPVPPIHS